MGDDRKELFSQSIWAGGRVYFLDVKVSAHGLRYLTISERPRRGEGEAHRVMVFEEHFARFQEAFNRAAQQFAPASPGPGTPARERRHPKDSAPKEYAPKEYAPWTAEDDALLMNAAGKSTAELARELGRRPSAITSRRRKLGLTPRG